MLDFEELAYALTQRITPEGVAVVPSIDVDSIDELPLVMFSVSIANALDGSAAPPEAWEGSISYTVLAHGRDRAASICKALYLGAWGWNDPWHGAGVVDGVGHITEITDRDVFSRDLTLIIDNRETNQYSGGFDAQFHAA